MFSKRNVFLWMILAITSAAFLLISPFSPGRQKIYPTPLALAPDQPVDSAYFCFDYPPNPETFVIQLDDPAKIQQARDMLSGNIPPRHVSGIIVKTHAPYNPPWSFHLAPDSIDFFDSSIEVCDSSISYLQDHIQLACGSFLPGCTWCPLGSRLVTEVTSPWFCRSIYLPLLDH